VEDYVSTNRIVRHFFFSLLLISLQPVVWAQNAREADFTGQPLIYAKDGALSACGVRFVAIESPLSNDKSVSIADGSLQLYANDGYMIFKLLAYQHKWPYVDTDRSKVLVVERGWLRAKGRLPTTAAADGKLLETTEPKGGVMYRTSNLVNDFGLLAAMASGEVVEVGLRLKGEVGERVLFGKIKLTDAEREQFFACTDDMLKGARERLERK
jgi:hypothetical protein